MGEAMGAMNMASLQGVDNSIASGVMAADTICDVLEGKEDMGYGERLRWSSGCGGVAVCGRCSRRVSFAE